MSGCAFMVRGADALRAIRNSSGGAAMMMSPGKGGSGEEVGVRGVSLRHLEPNASTEQTTNLRTTADKDPSRFHTKWEVSHEHMAATTGCARSTADIAN
jgi:hypothetical protein